MSLGHIGYPLLINKVHTRAEFEALKTGDSILKVEETDSVTSFTGNALLIGRAQTGIPYIILRMGLQLLNISLIKTARIIL